MLPRRVHIQRVCGEDRAPVRPQPVRHGVEGGVLLFRAGSQQRPSGRLGFLQYL
jgi:hypothetical protein